jgi:SAM-dependent methyltransferase
MPHLDTTGNAAFFNAEAAVWEREHGPDSVRAAGFRAITALLEDLISGCAAPPAMLDIGCATGAHLRALRFRLRLGVGVDFSHRMISTARDAAASAPDSSAAALRFIAGDATALRKAIDADDKMRDVTFDLVTMIGMLEHVADQARALASAAAMLAPGAGRLVVISPHRYSLLLLYHRFVHGGSQSPSFPAARHFTIGELSRLASDTGLRVERIVPIDPAGWHEANAVPLVLQKLDRLRFHLPGVRGLGSFAAIFRRRHRE